jgi:hypothetical protein
MKPPVKTTTTRKRGLDREVMADAKTNAALKSMSDRFDNPKGKNAGLTLSQAMGRRMMELKLFEQGQKLRKEKEDIVNKAKRDAGDVTRRKSGGKVKKGKK